MEEYLATAQTALEASKKIISQYFRNGVTVEDKNDASPVTIADRNAELAIRQVIESNHPSHAILGEEHGYSRAPSDFQWVIDPIDGTKSFISGMPTFGTLIALMESSAPKMGVIDMPMLNERWVGIKGGGAKKNGEACKVSMKENLDDAILYCTEPNMFSGQQKARFAELENEVKLRRFGGDCYCYGLLASGYIDLVVEGSLQYYDVMALVPVVEEAGGIITDWEGNSLKEGWNGLVVAAATKSLHKQALEVLNR
ncbi:histidinol-phosphatase [Parasalinivibrio latis]|uniref:histidinol-phosphatase n=1 Tax=Parasalinivibrio latis TaxID=2952610 RepID=UPI0030E496E1